MDLKATRYDVADRIAVVTLARPKRRNAWTGRMHTEYRWILREADLDPAVRVIVVTGDPEGNAFCVGVQWHPEWQPRSSPASVELFRRFGAAARGHSA